MSYTIHSGKSFNMVLSHRDESDDSTWNQNPDENLANMRKEFEGWDPTYASASSILDHANRVRAVYPR